MVEQQLLQIIRHVLNNDSFMGNLDWNAVWLLAKKHSLGQFVYIYMYHLPEDKRPSDDIWREISKGYSIMMACKIRQELAIDNLHSILEAAGCYHLFF